MPARVHRPQPLAWQVFRGSAAIRDGLLSPSALRGRAWTRLGHDVYGDSRLEQDHALRCHAAALVLPADAIFAGRSAAALLGLNAASFCDPIDVIIGPSSSYASRPGLRVHHASLEPVDIVDHGWCRMTSAARTAWDLANWQDTVSAVAVIDELLRTGAIAVADLAEINDRRSGARGNRLAQRAFELADERAQSMAESRLRVRLVMAGFPPPVPQCPVTLPSGLVLHPDLGWPEYRVGAEYDGLWHASAEQLNRDRRRLNLLVSAGWIILHVTGDRMLRDFAGILAEISQALMSRGWQPQDRRNFP